MKLDFKLIDIKTLKKVSGLIAGNYKTSFKGAGIEFEDLREYDFGDDVKDIDWKSSAKTGKLFIKKYEEERELTTLFLLDVGENMNFGIGEKLKIDTLLEAFLILAFSSEKNKDKMGMYFFKKNIAHVIPQKKGKQNIWLSIEKILGYRSSNNTGFSDVNSCLKKLYDQKTKDKLIILLTDEIDNINNKHLKVLSQKNDFIFINIFDDFENNLNEQGLFSLNIAKSNIILDSTDNKNREEYKKLRQEKLKKLKDSLVGMKCNYLCLTNKTNSYKELYKFFKLRQALQ